MSKDGFFRIKCFNNMFKRCFANPMFSNTSKTKISSNLIIE